MAKGGKYRRGKIVTAGHSTTIEGLLDFCKELEQWPEISSIRIGRLSHRNRRGRTSNSLKIDSPEIDPVTSQPRHLLPRVTTTRSHKRAAGGGGFNFQAKRDARAGDIITGIKCDAVCGTRMQEVVLCGSDLKALWRRLAAEGYHR